MVTGRKRLKRKNKRDLSKAWAFIFIPLLVLGIIIISKLPLISSPRKQYLITSTGQINKVAASESGTVEQTVVEAVKGASSSSEVVVGDEFVKWAVLDYYPDGYHVVYPDGFETSYTPERFEAAAPGGGKVVVSINGKNFTVSVDSSGVGTDQAKMLEAAANLVRSSFRFIGDSGYDPAETASRFGK